MFQNQKQRNTIHLLSPAPELRFQNIEVCDLSLKVDLEPEKYLTNVIFSSPGVEFTNAFASTPVCCPSRATILTGKYPHNSGTHTNRANGNCNGEQWRNGPEREAYATFLQVCDKKVLVELTQY